MFWWGILFACAVILAATVAQYRWERSRQPPR